MKLTFNKLFASVVVATALVGSVEGKKDFPKGPKGLRTKDQDRRLNTCTECQDFVVSSKTGETLGTLPLVTPPKTPPTSLPTFDIDGSDLDWGIAANCLSTTRDTCDSAYYLADMCNQGNCNELSNSDPVMRGRAYGHWDCVTGTLHVAVRAVTGFTFESSDSGRGQSWLRVVANQGDSSSTLTAEGSTGRPTNILVNGAVVGWEAKYTLGMNPALTRSCNFIEFHAQFIEGEADATTSTGKIQSGVGLPIDIRCPCTIEAQCGTSADQCTTISCDGCDCSYEDSDTCDTCTPEDTSQCSSPAACFVLTCPTDACTYTCDTTNPACCDIQGCPDCGGGGTDCTLEANPDGFCATQTPNVCDNYDSNCCTASCNTATGTCGASLAAAETECGLSGGEGVEKDCIAVNRICGDGRLCETVYQLQGIACTIFSVEAGKDEQCQTGVCTKPDDADLPVTECTATDKTDFTECSGDTCPVDPAPCSVAGSRGACHLGDKCVAGACNTMFYSGSDSFPGGFVEEEVIVCRPADPNKCCDKPEECAGDLSCPGDVAYGSADEVVCREPCVDCIGDETETCQGEFTCPNDIFFTNTLCLSAGNPKNGFDQAGTVTLTATREDGGMVKICYTISFDNPPGYAPLEFHADILKAETSSSPIKSAPGQMEFSGLDIYASKCITLGTLCPSSGSSFFLAFHFALDNGDTAWALKCPDESSSTTEVDGSFQFSNFYKKNGAQQGWGGFWRWTPCCYTDGEGGNQCGKCTTTGGNGEPPHEGSCTATCTCNEVDSQNPDVVVDNNACALPTRRLSFL